MLTISGFQKALEYWQLFLQGVVCTVSLSALTVVLGFILALVLATCRMGRSRILRAVSTAYVELFRATPMVVQVFIIFYVVFDGIKVLPGFKLFGFIRFERFFPAVVALALNSGAYLSEIIRSGIQSFHNIVCSSKRRQHNNRRVIAETLPVHAAQFQSVHTRHDDIQYQQIKRLILKQFPSRITIVHHRDLVTELTKPSFNERGNIYLILYQYYFCHKQICFSVGCKYTSL